MEELEIQTAIANFKSIKLNLPNGTENALYTFKFDEDFFPSYKIEKYLFTGLEDLGLTFSKDTLEITGYPMKSGTADFTLEFKILEEIEDAAFHSKEIKIILNPDPKLLWKNIPSDSEAIFWKEDNTAAAGKIGDRTIVVVSKRGRSHQNVGSFRDDDFAFQDFSDSGWGVVAVSDGAGSAALSREGSRVACNTIIAYFKEVILPNRELQDFEDSYLHFLDTKDETAFNDAKNEIKKSFYKGTLHVHNQLNALAKDTAAKYPEIFSAKKVKYLAESFHATLIFTAFKKIKDTYVIITFSVGDCPIGVVSKDESAATLLNWLDVGEFGGGTRFITQPDIFHSKERPMASRFNIHIQEDFSFLFLMSDGIYDPKFEVEVNLEKTEKWNDFIADLKGKNEADVQLNFNADETHIAEDLSKWMDFWSKGNHDDRTLAIIY